VRDAALRLYIEAAEFALTKGIIIADTKFEFGMDEKGVVTLMDEVLTPDSSRFWPAESYLEGLSPPSLDKQGVREWLESPVDFDTTWKKIAPAPRLPLSLIKETMERYLLALSRLKSGL
ncbi:MAG: phosphoribosylaminoimidazolesuccinocarboxamide synthase, partial [Chloroflexia bacterium]